MSDPTTPAQPMTRRELEAKIVAKAWRDPSFKALLLTDPKTALQHELEAIAPGVRLPAALQVQVHEETPTAYHLVLPRNPRDISLGEVLGGDLEAVAPHTVAVLAITNVSGIVNATVNQVGNVVVIVSPTVVGVSQVNAAVVSFATTIS